MERKLWLFYWLPGFGLDGSPLSPKQRIREIIRYLLLVILINTALVACAGFWLPVYVHAVLALAVPVLELPDFQRITSTEVSEDGSVLVLQISAEGTARQFPGLEPDFRRATGESFHPDTKFTIDLTFHSPFSSKLVHISLVIALTLALPNAVWKKRLTALAFLILCIYVYHAFSFVLYEQGLIFSRVYVLGENFFLQLFRSIANFFYLESHVGILFFWFLAGVVTRFGAKKA